jgi:HlyD family secretion protein
MGPDEMSSMDTMSSLRRFQIAGYVSMFVLVGAMGGWSLLSSINGAVIAPATIMAETNSKRVQHKDGGIIRSILVRDGDRVEAGQNLIVLDDTDTKSELAIITALLAEFMAKRARLEAERDGLETIEFPPEIAERRDDPVIAKLILGQEKLHAARLATIQGKINQLEQQIGQIGEQVQGIVAQSESKERQINYIADELVGLLDLKTKGLVSNSRVLAMQREQARLEGERGELMAAKATAESKVGEVRLQILQVREETLTQTLADMRDVEGRIAELSERKVSTASRLERTTITAPITGYVYQLAVHTNGGVITPAETLMLISPEADELILQAQIPPQSIDQVHEGQKARIRFAAFNSRTTPEIDAMVTSVSADTSRFDANTPPFYMVMLKIPAVELDRLGSNKLKPGMPAEAFIQTTARSPFSYLVKPLVDQIAHAWRER